MPLSQEEINKIHEEEAERAKARAAYTPKNSQTVIVKRKTGCLGWGCLTLILLILIPTVIAGVISGIKSSSPEERAKDAAAQTAAYEDKQQTLTELGRVEIVSTNIEMDSIGTPILVIKLKNNAGQAVDALTFEAHLLNNYDEPVGEWGNRSGDPFRGIVQDRIEAGKTFTGRYNLAVYDNATKVDSSAVVKIHFIDGSSYSL